MAEERGADLGLISSFSKFHDKIEEKEELRQNIANVQTTSNSCLHEGPLLCCSSSGFLLFSPLKGYYTEFQIRLEDLQMEDFTSNEKLLNAKFEFVLNER